MRLLKKILAGFAVFTLLLAGAVVLFIGPWPVYTSGYEGTRYFNNSVARIESAAKLCNVTDTPGPLKVGWGVAKITPPPGTPLAGYSARAGKQANGVLDDVHVKAVAFSDGKDTAVVVGADMLLIPPNVADAVREAVAKEIPLGAGNLFFTASHTHDSVGAFMPGLIAAISFGQYDPKIPPFLAKAFTAAVLDAYRSMAPAKFAHGAVDAPQHIHNRTRNAGVDPALNWMVIEKENGERCYITRFSAHPTLLDDDNLDVSGEYPGFLQRAIEGATGATAVFLGGAVGSMSPDAPDAPTDYGKCETLGNALAALVLEDSRDAVLAADADVACVSVPVDLPPLQMRLWSEKWRLSPLSRLITGIRTNGWMSAVRVGDAVFVNAPGDFSGEIAADWRKWAGGRGIDLWVSGFSGEYIGYISPDRYYGELRDSKGGIAYETGQLSWAGPHMEAFFTDLMRRMVGAVSGQASVQTAAAR
ncbi:MAG: hypothetical protein GX580_12545 [Candidatus Hydrogenedens sp.]|nr:neutral/alkaline non-lysosomal ceramidase N-terminal domain-containing protein [Candidatus Hydrogenedentota bacterium]NLF58454.1 hypothetical protein [Candidatus Hydrogenedens sp.]